MGDYPSRYSDRQVVESYMVFGGIPYYLDLQERGMRLAQNVDALLFTRGGQLVPEFDRLYATLFRNPAPYVAAVRALSRKRMGMTRSELSAAIDLDGSGLTKVLRDLDLCGFLRPYRDFTKPTNGKIYQLSDPFSLFCLSFVDGGGLDGDHTVFRRPPVGAHRQDSAMVLGDPESRVKVKVAGCPGVCELHDARSDSIVGPTRDAERG